MVVHGYVRKLIMEADECLRHVCDRLEEAKTAFSDGQSKGFYQGVLDDKESHQYKRALNGLNNQIKEASDFFAMLRNTVCHPEIGKEYAKWRLLKKLDRYNATVDAAKVTDAIINTGSGRPGLEKCLEEIIRGANQLLQNKNYVDNLSLPPPETKGEVVVQVQVEQKALVQALYLLIDYRTFRKGYESNKKEAQLSHRIAEVVKDITKSVKDTIMPYS